MEKNSLFQKRMKNKQMTDERSKDSLINKPKHLVDTNHGFFEDCGTDKTINVQINNGKF